MSKTFVQRGNYTDCLQWNGFNVDAIKEFIKPRLDKDFDFETLEFIVTQFRHLIIVANFGITQPVVAGKMAITRGTWLVDQGPYTEGPFGVVFCEELRFHHLYREVGEDYGSS